MPAGKKGPHQCPTNVSGSTGHNDHSVNLKLSAPYSAWAVNSRAKTSNVGWP
jgi:hypothetical protein